MAHDSLPGRTPASQRRQQPGPQRRRLSAARRADDPHQRGAGEPRDHLGDQPLAAEEQAGVLDIEGSEALERARDDVGARERPLTQRLQLDDAASQVVLGHAQVGAPGRRAAGGAAEPLLGLRARPLRGGAMHGRGDASGRLEQQLDRDLAPRRVVARDRDDIVGAERGEPPRRRPGQSRRVLGGREDQHGARGEPIEVPGWLAHVIEHQQRRPRGTERARQGARVAARCVEDPGALAQDAAGQLAGEPRLADPGRAGDHDRATGPRTRPPPVLSQPGEVLLASRERRVAVELGRQLERLRWRQRQRRVLRQDLALELAQMLAGLDPEVADQRPARVRVGLQRLRLAVGAVEGEHQERPQPLPVGVLADQPAEPGDDRVVLAEGEHRLEQPLDRDHPQLLQAGDLGLGERLAGEVAERRPAPLAERRLERRDRLTGVPGRELPAPVLGEGLEAVRVEGVGLDAELVSVVPCQQRSRDAVARDGERLAQARHVDLHGLRRRRRRLVSPQLVDHARRAQRLVAVQQQEAEQRPLLAPLHGDFAALVEHFERTEDAVVHHWGSSGSDRTYTRRSHRTMSAHRAFTALLPRSRRPATRCPQYPGTTFPVRWRPS